MRIKLKKIALLLFLAIPLIACSTYNKVANTKKLDNYAYTLQKSITFNDEETKTITEKGYVNDNIEKRITTIENDSSTTYFKRKNNDTYMYYLKDNKYVEKKIPYNTYSYLNLIDVKWITYKNNKIELNNKVHQKILKLLHIHKYKADDIEVSDIKYNDNDKYITQIDVTLNLLKNKETVGIAKIQFTIDEIGTIDNIDIPYKQK